MKDWKKLYSKEWQSLKASGYSDKAIDHFLRPRNVGTLDDADAIAVAGDKSCGDFVELSIKVDSNTKKIEKINFRAFGGNSVLIMSSVLTEIAKGKTLQEALNVTESDVQAHIGEVPDDKHLCSHLAIAALGAAIKSYVIKRSKNNKRDIFDDGKDSIASID